MKFVWTQDGEEQELDMPNARLVRFGQNIKGELSNTDGVLAEELTSRRQDLKIAIVGATMLQQVRFMDFCFAANKQVIVGEGDGSVLFDVVLYNFNAIEFDGDGNCAFRLWDKEVKDYLRDDDGNFLEDE